MPIPDRDTIKAALVAYISNYGGVARSLRPSEIYDGLAEEFALTPDDRARVRGTDEPFWENEVRWARQALVEDGVILRIEESERGVWKLASSVGSGDSVANHKLPGDFVNASVEFAEIQSDLTDEGVFSPASVQDARDIVIRAIVQRRGQQQFRSALLLAYNSRCCISGESCVAVLEAAHIVPYRGKETNHVQNGLLLRSDLHTLFDLRIITIDPASLQVRVSPAIQSPTYSKLDGVSISLPSEPSQRPSDEALKAHFESCGF